MPGPRLSLKVGGKELRQHAAYGDLGLSWSWSGGCKELKFQITAKYGSRLPTIVRGAVTEALWGGWPVWKGNLSEPDWNGNEATLTASGLVRRGERFQAFSSNSLLTTTSNPTTAITQANSRGTGLGWTVGTGVPNASLTVELTEPVNSITALMDAHAEKDTKRWGVDAFGVATMTADPTTPTLYVTPGSGDLGIADDNYASNVILNHVTTTGAYRRAVYPTFATVSAYEAKYDHSEFVRDITDRGPIADATADALAQAVYDRSKARPGWTNGLDLAHGEVRNAGGVPLHPLWVASQGYGALCRLQGVPDEVALTPYTQFVVGETSWTEGSETVQVNPVGLVSRTQEDVLTELLEAMFPNEEAA